MIVHGEIDLQTFRDATQIFMTQQDFCLFVSLVLICLGFEQQVFQAFQKLQTFDTPLFLNFFISQESLLEERKLYF